VFVLDRRGGTDVRGFGDGDVVSAEMAAIAATTPAAGGISLFTYYCMAVAAGVTVYLITTRLLGRKA
jgi:hypothetical protein